MGRILRDQTLMEGINTERANDFAQDSRRNPGDVRLNWWELFSNYRTKKWKQEIKNLRDETGISFEEVCSYIGVPQTRLPGFYRRLPKTKSIYIGIGMAYKLPLSTINRWLIKYGGKKKLYVKDFLTDLTWIYLINANHQDSDSDKNYFMLYDKCCEQINEVYLSLDKEVPSEEIDTVNLNNAACCVDFDDEHVQIKDFVRTNMAAFKSAYAKPRAFLLQFLDNILRVKNENLESGRSWTLNTLRGYLDDSMINYLTSRHREGPKSKKSHIAMGMALGMTGADLNRYLELMGYSRLDATSLDEGVLLNLLEKWEAQHPLQRLFKNRYIYNNEAASMTLEEESLSVNDMLRLRADIKDLYDTYTSNSGNNRKFPYMND